MIYLRAADQFDAPALARLRAASLIEQELLLPADAGPFALRAQVEIRALFRADRVAAWIACDGEAVVASSCAVFYERLPYPEGSRHAELCGVYVMPAYRKCGFASELVSETVAAARAGGARKTFLRPSPTAKSLYARLGFVDTALMAFDCRTPGAPAAEQRDVPDAARAAQEAPPRGVKGLPGGYAAIDDDRDHPRRPDPAGSARPSVHQRIVRL